GGFSRDDQRIEDTSHILADRQEKLISIPEQILASGGLQNLGFPCRPRVVILQDCLEVRVSHVYLGKGHGPLPTGARGRCMRIISRPRCSSGGSTITLNPYRS